MYITRCIARPRTLQYPRPSRSKLLIVTGSSLQLGRARWRTGLYWAGPGLIYKYVYKPVRCSLSGPRHADTAVLYITYVISKARDCYRPEYASPGLMPQPAPGSRRETGKERALGGMARPERYPVCTVRYRPLGSPTATPKRSYVHVRVVPP